MLVSIVSLSIPGPFLLFGGIYHQNIYRGWIHIFQWKYTGQARFAQYSSDGKVPQYSSGGSGWKLALQLLGSSKRPRSWGKIREIKLKTIWLDWIKAYKKHNSVGWNDKSEAGVNISSHYLQKDIFARRRVVICLYISRFFVSWWWLMWIQGWRSKHLHEDFKTWSDFKSSHSCVDGFEVPKSVVEEVQAWKIEEFHFV